MFIELMCIRPFKTGSDFNKRNVSLNCQFFNTSHQHFPYTATLKFR